MSTCSRRITMGTWMRSAVVGLGVVAALWTAALACGGKAADRFLIGAECSDAGQCQNAALTCLSEFKGGYCGAKGCTQDSDCLEGSLCVSYQGASYCFRACVDKPECNT